MIACCNNKPATTVSLDSPSDLSVSSMNCSAPPFNINVYVLDLGHLVNKLYLWQRQCNLCHMI